MIRQRGSCRLQIAQRELPIAQRASLKFLRRVVLTTLECADYWRSCEISLTLTGDQKIRALNAEYRDKDEATDVLSFALQEGMEMFSPPGMPLNLGDIVVSWETVERQAQNNNVAAQAELGWVVCHGTLHLLGYDHQNEEQRSVMRNLEVRVLERLHLQKPVLV